MPNELQNNKVISKKNINSRNSKVVRVLIIVMTILICSFFSFMNYRKSIVKSDVLIHNIGNFWTSPTLVADYNFSVYKQQVQYRAEVQNARDSVNPVFILDAYAENNLVERIKGIAENLLEHNDSLLKNYTTPDKLRIFYSQNEANQIKEIARITNQLIPFIQQIYRNGYIDVPLDRFRINECFAIRSLINTEDYIEKGNVYDKEKYSIALQQFCSDVFNGETEQLIVDIVFQLAQPNLVKSDELTMRAALNAEQSVRKTISIIHKGEVIVERGERLTEDIILRIKSYNDSNHAKGDTGFSFWNLLGNIGHSVMQYSLLLIFIIIIRKRIWADNYQLLLLSLPLIIVSLLGWITFQIQSVNPNAPIEYLIVVPAFSMFVAIIFDSRTAFYTTVSMAMILAGVRGNDYFFGLTMLFTGMIAGYSVKDIQDRTQMFSSIIFIFIGFVLSILVIGFERGYNFSAMMPQLFLGLINAITAPIITFLLLICINKYTHTFVNNLKLREYIEKEHPLITKMREIAPGTFEHSRELSHLAASSAAAIDANILLVKVSALFHDIGKLKSPEFFTENKEHYKELLTHTHLTPQQSAKIIINHVADGLAMAKELGLPQSMIDFIPQHHGTYIVKHFYNVALNNAREKGEIVNEANFRYTGPKPQNKETTILMLCDFAEALSKVITDFEQYKNALQTNIEERIKDGQFDESDITLKEIITIKNVILNEIKGKLLTRTQYATANDKNINDKKISIAERD